jgi:ABC-type spermidine/putrescine transport system permease subunit II
MRRRPNDGTPRAGLLFLFPIAAGLFLYIPIFVVIAFSFNSSKSLATFEHPSLHWYSRALHDGGLWSSVLVSVEIAAVTAVVALALGTALAVGLERVQGKAARGGGGLLALTLITPEIALGFSLLLMFTTLGVTLSQWTVTLGHITFSLAYVTLIVRARLTMLREDLEEAAMDLGASRWDAIRLVTIPQLWPALLGAGMLVFVLSFDDFVVSLFASGIGTSPLPVRIYSMIRFGVTPEINAIATLMMVSSILIGVGSIVLTRRQWTSTVSAPLPTEGAA